MNLSWRQFLVYFGELLSDFRDYQVPVERSPNQLALPARSTIPASPAEITSPYGDSEWWQSPLDKVIGRDSPTKVERFYPKNAEEAMTLSRKFM